MEELSCIESGLTPACQAFPNLEAKPQVLQVALGSDPQHPGRTHFSPPSPGFPVRMLCEKCCTEYRYSPSTFGRCRDSGVTE
jgi:hypothetical protein